MCKNFTTLSAMETRKHEPDMDQVAQRSRITPFGRASKCSTESPVPVAFKLYSTEKEPQKAEGDQGIYQASSSIYKPPAIPLVYKLKEVSVRITNIPDNVSQRDLLELLLEKCGRIFYRCNLIYDRETRASRGFAYASCENIEKARELARIVRNIVIDGFALSAEVIANE